MSATDPITPSLDEAMADDAVLGIYRRMFAPLARDSGAVASDPAMVDIADACPAQLPGRARKA